MICDSSVILNKFPADPAETFPVFHHSAELREATEFTAHIVQQLPVWCAYLRLQLGMFSIGGRPGVGPLERKTQPPLGRTGSWVDTKHLSPEQVYIWREPVTV